MPEVSRIAQMTAEGVMDRTAYSAKQANRLSHLPTTPYSSARVNYRPALIVGSFVEKRTDLGPQESDLERLFFKKWMPREDSNLDRRNQNP